MSFEFCSENVHMWEECEYQGHQYLFLEHTSSDYPIRAYKAQRQWLNLKWPTAMFHGMEAKWEIWDSILWNLEIPSPIYSLDLPWSGRQGYQWGLDTSASDWIKYSLEIIPYDVSIIIAHSFGTSAILEYLNSFPCHSVKAIILISPFYKENWKLFDWSVMTHYMNHFQDLLEEGLRMQIKADMPSKETLISMAEKVRDRIGPYGWLQFFNHFTRSPYLNLQNINIPCLVIGGEDDIASIANDCKALARRLPNSTLEIIPDCGHFCMLDKPKIVLDKINLFLKHTLDSSLYIAS